MQKLSIEGRKLATGLTFPEGPVAMPDGSVLLVEIMNGSLLRVLPDGTKQVVAVPGGGANGAAIGLDGACYICNNGGLNFITEANGYIRPHGRFDGYISGSIQRVDLVTGALTTLYSDCDGEPLTGPNDLVFDEHGGFWFTDHGKSYGRLLDRGAVFYALADGSFSKEVAFPVMTPNGIGLSPDGKTSYVSETEPGRLWSYPVIAPGELAKEPWPSPNGGKFMAGPQGYQRFESLAVEANGNICVGSLVYGGISVFSPDGTLVEFHEAPEGYCTNIAFGGPDMQTAYITLSGVGHLLEVEWPRPGLRLIHQQG